MVEEMRVARGIDVSHQTMRQGALKFGQAFANRVRRLPAASDKWHMDEVVIANGGRNYWLWRAVDQHGVEFDILIQSSRNKATAGRILRKPVSKLILSPRVNA